MQCTLFFTFEDALQRCVNKYLSIFDTMENHEAITFLGP